MWWYRALHAELLAALAKATPQTGHQTGHQTGRPVLDAGCGTGGFLCRLAERLPGRPRIGVELMEQAARLARTRAKAALSVGSVNALPLADGAIGAVVSADVLCHARVDQAAALAEFHRVLAPGGVLVLNLPAFRWLASAHDRAVHNARRYTRAEVATMLAEGGFRVHRVCYWNSLLFPLMLIQRKVLGRHAAKSDVRLLPAPVEVVFGAVTALERWLARHDLRLPFGGSVLAVACKP